MFCLWQLYEKINTNDLFRIGGESTWAQNRTVRKYHRLVISDFFGLHNNSRYITSITILRILPVMLLTEGGISITFENYKDVSGLEMKD